MKRSVFLLMLLSILVVLSGCILVLKCIDFKALVSGSKHCFGGVLW